MRAPDKQQGASSLNAILSEMAGQPDISAVVVIGWDGFVIDHAAKGELDVDAIGAVISTGIGSGQVMGSELGVGDMSQAMYEFANGVIMVSGLADRAILAVIADASGNIGNVRYQVSKRADEILAAL